MQPASFIRTHVAVAGLVALLGVASLAQQEPSNKKYLLKDAVAAVGDVSVIDLSSAIKLEMFAKPQGVEGAVPISFQLTQDEREKYTETVLAVGKAGISHIRRVYSLSRLQKRGPAGNLKTTSRSYQGKTVTIKRSGAKTIVTIAKGKLSSDDVKELQQRFDGDSNFRFFPSHEVGPGDEWTLDEALIKKKYGAEHASLKAQFVDVVPFQGRQCARITVNLQMEGKAGKNPLIWEMKGETYYALDLQRILSTKLSGPLSTQGTGNRGEVVLDIEGLGTGTLNHSQRWLKVAGKPPAVQP